MYRNLKTVLCRGNPLCLVQPRSISDVASKPKVFLVVGATGGIGEELCSRLAALPSAHVVFAGRNEDKLSALQERGEYR